MNPQDTESGPDCVANPTCTHPDQSMPTRPNALIVGPQKAGTSWLYEYLQNRDDVALPSGTKETFFFDDRFESKGREWYFKHFQGAANPQVKTILEVAPTYFHPPEVPQRVFDTLGKITVVVTLRDPAKRAFSLFQHMRRYGFTKATDFREAVAAHPEILASSRYAECIQRWQDTMGADNVTILFIDDLIADPQLFASACCDAFGLTPPQSAAEFPDQVNVAAEPRNYYVALAGRLVGDALRSVRLYSVVAAAKRVGLKKLFFGKPQVQRQAITSVERAWFIDQIADDLGTLQAMTERDLSHWMTFEGDSP